MPQMHENLIKLHNDYCDEVSELKQMYRAATSTFSEKAIMLMAQSLVDDYEIESAVIEHALQQALVCWQGVNSNEADQQRDAA